VGLEDDMNMEELMRENERLKLDCRNWEYQWKIADNNYAEALKELDRLKAQLAKPVYRWDMEDRS
jgi:hypothetical protein